MVYKKLLHEAEVTFALFGKLSANLLRKSLSFAPAFEFLSELFTFSISRSSSSLRLFQLRTARGTALLKAANKPIGFTCDIFLKTLGAC
jgi:hypothetical protein